MKRLAIVAALLLASPALAQNADPDFLRHAIEAVAVQRNQAMDALAVAQAHLAQANAKIKALEEATKKAPDEKKP